MPDGTKPTITIPDNKPPAELTTEDLEVGTGSEATPGVTVNVHYVGVSWSNGKEFDSSWDRGEHFSFPLGAGHVIPGWDRGVAGMREGGRRRLTIPPHLGYGSTGGRGGRDRAKRDPRVHRGPDQHRLKLGAQRTGSGHLQPT